MQCQTEEPEYDHRERSGGEYTDTEVYVHGMHEGSRGVKRAGINDVTEGTSQLARECKGSRASRYQDAAKRRRRGSIVSCPAITYESARPERLTSTRSMPTPAASQTTSENEERIHVTDVNEWLIQSFVSKRLILEGVGVFRLEFERPLCTEHGQVNTSPGNSHGLTTTERTQGRKRRTCGGARAKFTREEDKLLIKLRRQGSLPWSEIYQRFSLAFPGRSRGSLQVHYSTKLKDL